MKTENEYAYRGKRINCVKYSTLTHIAADYASLQKAQYANVERVTEINDTGVSKNTVSRREIQLSKDN